MSLNEKVALVTGATRGIGAAIAQALGEAGATVIGTATTEAGAEKISQRFKELNLRCLRHHSALQSCTTQAGQQNQSSPVEG